MKFKKNYFVSSLVSSLVISASAVDFTWTGDAGDGDWENAGNWDTNGIPVDDLPDTNADSTGLTLSTTDAIIFAGPNMPTTNVPGYGGDFAENSEDGNSSSPTMFFNSGGSISFDHTGRDNSFWTNLAPYTRTLLTVGDGVTGADEDVTVTFNGLTRSVNRHNNGELSFVINEDGILNINGEIQRWGDNTSRPAIMVIDGGTVNLSTSVPDVNFNERAIEFLSVGGSFTAEFGREFPDLTSVTTALGVNFINSGETGILNAIDNGDNTFTVTSVEGFELTNNWTGLGGATWDQSTTVNFTTNSANAPLVEGTFDDAIAAEGEVTFADQYFDNGTGIAVTNTTINIIGGVQGTENVFFDNDSVSYTLESEDELGISGTTSLFVDGDGLLILRGDHSSTGATTIFSGSTLTFDATDGEAWSYSSLLGNQGNIEKTGGGSYTLVNGSVNTGATTVTAGELILQGEEHSANAVNIAAGATLTYDTTEGNNRVGIVGTISGDGILRKTGTGGLNWENATFALSANALVDIQEGTVNGGSLANEDWSENLSDLNIADDAVFTTVEANVFVDAVTGNGTLRTGFDGAGYEELTIGVMNGDATFNGLVEDQNVAADDLGALTKVGTGTQTFTGESTLHGDYTVEEGTLIYTSTSSITFYPTLNDTTNQILGRGASTGAIDIDGAINIDFSGTEIAFDNTWLLIDRSSLSIITGPSFNVTSSAGDFSEGNPGIWTLDTGGNLWTFTVSTGILQLAEGTPSVGFEAFQTNFFTPEEIIAGGADVDFDFDGGALDNGIEFVVGGDPTDSSDDAAFAPTLTEVDGGFLFTFRRTDDSAPDDPGVEYDTDLIGEFTPAIDGVEGVTINVIDDGFEAGIDQVEVFLPDSLAVDGRLFARLTVTPNGAN